MIVHSNQTGLNESEARERFQMILERGDMLSKQSNFVLYESKNARTQGELRQSRITMGHLMEGMNSYPSHVKAGMAVMLENLHKTIARMDETTRTLSIGDFDKYAFPIVRAVFPNLIAQEIVSVQPMLGPTSMIFYMAFVRAMSKGSANAGENIHENPAPFYGSDKVDQEQLSGGATNFVGAAGTAAALKWKPIVPGSFKATCVSGGATLTVYDDGNGAIAGDIGVGTNTIDYQSGAYDFDFSGASDSGTAYCTYAYDQEANPNIPEIDLTINSEAVEAKSHKLKTVFSIEAAQDLRSQHGLDADTELTAALANEIRFEIDRLILADLRAAAAASGAPGVSFPLLPPAGIDSTQYLLNFNNYAIKASYNILEATQRSRGTFIVAGIGACAMMESLPGFKGVGALTGRGVWKAGRLNNMFDVYCDSYMPKYQWLMGYKGENMFETGYVFAPYVLLYTTPPVSLDDFKTRKGIASRFGRKVIDARFFNLNSMAPAATGTNVPIF